jgi:hypothetical protein
MFNHACIKQDNLKINFLHQAMCNKFCQKLSECFTWMKPAIIMSVWQIEVWGYFALQLSGSEDQKCSSLCYSVHFISSHGSLKWFKTSCLWISWKYLDKAEIIWKLHKNLPNHVKNSVMTWIFQSFKEYNSSNYSWGNHTTYKEWRLLGCYAVWLL